MKLNTKLLSILCFALFCCFIVEAQDVAARIKVRAFLAPEYPAVAYQARIQGDLRLRVSVNTDGKIISIDSSSGADILVAEAKADVVEWTYTPMGEPVKLDIIYTFRLEKPETERSPVPRVRVESPVLIIITSNLPRITRIVA